MYLLVRFREAEAIADIPETIIECLRSLSLPPALHKKKSCYYNKYSNIDSEEIQQENILHKEKAVY